MLQKISTFLLFLCLSTSLFATTFRVNNTPGTDPDFDNLIDAHAIAQNGDTLMIEGSNNSYGNLTMTKRLTIIGPGYFLDENPDSAVSLPAKINSIELARSISADPSSGAAGSEIIGLDFSFTNFTRALFIYVNDVIIKKCRTRGIGIQQQNSIQPAIGIQIIQNYIIGGISTVNANNGPIVNIQIVNNIFSSSLFLRSNSSGAILHNLFVDGLEASSFSGEIRSNILLSNNQNDVILPTLPNNQITHNTAANGQFGDVNGNNTTLVTNLFVGPTNNSTDGQWQLQPNSLASNTAHDGTDRGPFGGIVPYVLSGQGGSPAIIFFEAEPVGTASNQLNVRIRAKSSN